MTIFHQARPMVLLHQTPTKSDDGPKLERCYDIRSNVLNDLAKAKRRRTEKKESCYDISYNELLTKCEISEALLQDVLAQLLRDYAEHTNSVLGLG